MKPPSRSSVLLSVALCLVGALALCSCGATTRAPKSPREVLDSYATALQAGRAEVAYGMLSDAAKREYSLDAFRRMIRENPDEVKDIARSLLRPSSPPVVTATINARNGESMVLVYQGGRWLIDSSAIDLYAQNTPRQAVSSFVRAFERRRYDIVLRFVPDTKRVGLTPKKLQEAWEGPQKHAMQKLVQAVKSALPSANFEEVGDRATMPFGAMDTVQLIREHGLWKVVDFN